MQGLKEAAAGAAIVKGAVRWLCAAAGREAVSKPEVAAAVLTPALVMPAVTASGKGCWAWHPFAIKLGTAGVWNPLPQLGAEQQLAATLVTAMAPRG